MPLTLTVDAGAWGTHLEKVATSRPGLVPVCKGNGYGFGITRIVDRAARLPGVDTVAVGTLAELADVAGTALDVLVLTPDPGAVAPVTGPPPSQVIRTASTVGDVETMLAAGQRFVVECRTELNRHGIPAEQFPALARVLYPAPGTTRLLAGWGMHLPLARPGSWGRSVRDRVAALTAAGLNAATVYVSHLDVAELAELGAALPGSRFRPRVGTDLWLGDRGALHPTATVLEVHRLPAGAGAGYWQRRTGTAGDLLVVAGGTAHGIGLTAPPPPSTRRRLGTLRAAVADSTGHARSPFVLDGSVLEFFEPPHMQVSLLWLPAGTARRPGPLAPARGSELALRVRYTTTTFDDVQLTAAPA